MSTNRQLDLFVALIGDVPFRDKREAMSAPLVSLSKNKPIRIEWEGRATAGIQQGRVSTD